MIHSFLLIGQSNMAGRGEISDAMPIDTTRIKTLRNGRWQPMFRPINPDRAFSGVNLAESFAQAYAQKYNVDVGLICCADGGTNLEQWQEGGLLYENAVYQAKLAMRTSTLVGVLWHQGESDCREELYPLYTQSFTKIMQALKRDLPLQGVPFLLGGLGDFLGDCDDFPYVKNYRKINEQLQAIAQNTPMTAFVSAEKLTGKPDRLHFDSKALYSFGLRYFEAFERIRNTDIRPSSTFQEDERSEMEKL